MNSKSRLRSLKVLLFIAAAAVWTYDAVLLREMPHSLNQGENSASLHVMEGAVHEPADSIPTTGIQHNPFAWAYDGGLVIRQKRTDHINRESVSALKSFIAGAGGRATHNTADWDYTGYIVASELRSAFLRSKAGSSSVLKPEDVREATRWLSDDSLLLFEEGRVCTLSLKRNTLSPGKIYALIDQ